MNSNGITIGCLFVAILPVLALSACHGARADETAEAPPPAKITPGVDITLFSVDHPDQFPIATAAQRPATSELIVTGAVTPDVSRNVPVVSLASGRVMAIHARLGDTVQKGQLLLTIRSDDVSGAYSNYRKAIADEILARAQLERAKDLHNHGALAQADLEVAQDIEDKAKVDLETSAEHVRVLGGDLAHASPLIELRAPVSGAIVEQNVAGFEGIKSLDNTPNLFTIADLSQVWVVCDVFENDLGKVALGDVAEIRLNAFPDRAFHGRVADISRVLDPNTRSAKVRIVLANAHGVLRPGMFATATFRSRKLGTVLVVPTTAIMRLQDKDWVFRKDGPTRFRRMEVHATGVTADGFQEFEGALAPGDEVVANALQFSTAMAENKE